MSATNNYIMISYPPCKTIDGETKYISFIFNLDINCVITEKDLVLHTSGIDTLQWFDRIELYYNNILISKREFNTISIKLNDGMCKLTDIFNDMKFNLLISKDKPLSIRMKRNMEHCTLNKLEWHIPNLCIYNNTIYTYKEYLVPIINSHFDFAKEPMTEIKGIYLTDDYGIAIPLKDDEYEMNIKDDILYEVSVNNKNKLPFVLIKAIKTF